MAPDTASPEASSRDWWLRWSNGLSLRQRILAVNVFALALLAGSVFYLDSFRARIVEERVTQTAREAEVTAIALSRMASEARPQLLDALGDREGTRLRMADANGMILADSWASGPRGWDIKDPADEPWQRTVARWMDDAIDFAADAKPPERFAGFSPPQSWRVGGTGWLLAKDRTHVIWAAVALPQAQGQTLMLEWNARDIRRLVRAERTRLGYIIFGVTWLSVLLSLFLARTIAEPLRSLSHAAIRVRHGRDREVNVPRLPDRRDEIGLLARSLSDMTHALRQRMDAIEAFAADVAHELKNPLASLSSATQSLRRTRNDAVKTQLEAIIDQDVVRLNRLITDISDLSRIEARLARTRFEPVDLGPLIEQVLADRKARGSDPVEIAFARPFAHTATVNGDAAQLRRVIENLLSNAVSFSPPDGVVRIAATRDGAHVLLIIDDDGPGIPESAREAIFERFHSHRQEEAFGEHSGLGLSIARTIINGHDGSISAVSREDGQQGARFIVRIPALEISTP